MSIVLRALQGRRFAMFEDLFDPRRGVPVLVVTFIALLELARERLLEVTQAERSRRSTSDWPISLLRRAVCDGEPRRRRG
jgi:chromatin segregation and condensation protein Rec8/ScpA/Scc1 (kleisin family)